MHTDAIGRAALTCLLLLAAACPAPAQQTPGRDTFVPPIAGQWQPVLSLGQPSPWRPYVGAGVGIDAPFRTNAVGLTGTAGVYRDIVNPVLAMLGVAGEAYAGQRADRFDPGARVMLVSPAFYVRAGADWGIRRGSIDPVIGLALPPTRGGWFGQGGLLRVDWVPGREHSVVAGFEMPIGYHFSRRSRPRFVGAPLPEAATPRRTAPADPTLLASMRWITQLQTFPWRMSDGPLAHDAAVSHARHSLQGFAADLVARTGPTRDRSVYDEVVARYHDSFTAAFDAVLGTADQGDATDPAHSLPSAEVVAAEARRIVMEEVVLPYNRLICQPRQNDQLHGLAARARARFLALLLLRDAPTVTVDASMALFDDWLRNFDRVRADLARATRDPRMHWLPLALVLRPEEHASQAQVDAIVEQALGRPFTTGNRTRYIDAMQFQDELERTIHETAEYHVLWVHDYRGRNEDGEPDRVGFRQTAEGYLPALLNAVRRYDQTGRLPVWMIVIDQHSYEEHDARVWFDLLERPLTHRVRLPATHAGMQARIDALQDSLRMAVAASRRLSADAIAFGDDWLAQVVRVHVNVTFTSDPSFRAPRTLRLPFAGDNLMRDHRKIVIRDVTEADPAAGEVILTGVGVGERYASPAWDDRGIVLTGPGALEAKHAARAVFTAHGLGGASMPPPLRPAPPADDHGARVDALVAAGATARVLQVHNATGFGDKDATFVQMLLFDLAPAGTVIYVPDSLWLSFDRLGQLMQAALRGCHVFIVMPALDNAPNTGFPQLSRMQELATRAVLVQEILGGVIRAGGGDFRVGFYTRESPLNDVAGSVADIRSTFADAPFIAELFPLGEHVWAALDAVAREYGSPPAAAGAADDDGQRPMLHRKTQLLASREALAAMATAPGLDSLFTAKLRARADTSALAPGALTADQASARLAELYRAVQPADALLYLMAGTMNMDPRSAMLDGEATALVAGSGAAQAFMDFVVLSGGVTWVNSVDEAVALLPPLGRLQRWVGRVLHPVL